jgi:ABC-type glutathione transport system ATPase component
MAATTTVTMAPASVSPIRSDCQEDDDSSLGNWTVVSDTPTIHASNVSEAQRRKVRPRSCVCPVQGQTRLISPVTEIEQVRSRIERSRQRQAVNEALEKAWISMSNVLFSPPTRWLDPQQQQDSIFPHPHSSSGDKPVKRTWGRTRLQ